MKTCSKCGEIKALDLFSKNSRNADGRHPWCKPCFSAYERERYRNGDKARKDRNKARIVNGNRDKLWDLLTRSACTDCGETDPLVLEFDHRDPAEKEFQVTQMFHYNWSLIQTEIDKCDVVCCNCHRRRTNKMFGWWRTSMPQ
jgi:hypothetical protein